MNDQNTQPALPAPRGPGVVRQDGGKTEVERRPETATALMAAQAEAMVKARFVVALQRPRDWDQVRAKLLRACERPGFAGSAVEKTWGAGWYRKPVGEGAEGFSIRFAEEAMRCMTNLDVEPVVVFEDEWKRMLSLNVLDLESNIAIKQPITIEKTVTRRYLRKNEVAIKTKVNSKDETTYVVEATEDDMAQKQGRLISMAMRNGVMRMVPGDIQADCRKRILEIRDGEAAKDPDGYRKKVIDSFATLNVTPSDLKAFLAGDIAKASPAQLTDLREIYTQISEGKTTWAEVSKGEEHEPETEKKAPPPKSGLDAVTDRLRTEAEKQCTHTKVPPSKVSALQAGQAGQGLRCPDCKAELTREDFPDA